MRRMVLFLTQLRLFFVVIIIVSMIIGIYYSYCDHICYCYYDFCYIE